MLPPGLPSNDSTRVCRAGFAPVEPALRHRPADTVGTADAADRRGASLHGAHSCGWPSRRGRLGTRDATRSISAARAPRRPTGDRGDRSPHTLRRRCALFRDPVPRPQRCRHRLDAAHARRRPRRRRSPHHRPRPLLRPPQRLLLPDQSGGRSQRRADLEQRGSAHPRLGRHLERLGPANRPRVDCRGRDPVQDVAIQARSARVGAERRAADQAQAGNRPLDCGRPEHLDWQPRGSRTARGPLRRSTGTRS